MKYRMKYRDNYKGFGFKIYFKHTDFHLNWIKATMIA